MFHKLVIILAVCLPAVLSEDFLFGKRKDNDVVLVNVTQKEDNLDRVGPTELYELIHEYSPAKNSVSKMKLIIQIEFYNVTDVSPTGEFTVEDKSHQSYRHRRNFGQYLTGRTWR